MVICSHLSGQADKLFVSLDYSPNVTSVTSPFGTVERGTFRYAGNLFAKVGYKVTDHLFVSAGFGYLNAKDFVSYDFIPQVEYDRIEQLRIHSYVVAPVGLTYYMGSFFISPEIGIGWNVANRHKDVLYANDGTITRGERKDEYNIYDVNTMTFPLFLSLGNEIEFNTCSLLLGVKGYYALNSIGQHGTNAGHYYGFGLLAGVKF